MSILFFDGFDRSVALKGWDTNYWSYQPGLPLEYERYAFGGYGYSQTTTDYNYLDEWWESNIQNYYNYSPNGGILPSGNFRGFWNGGNCGSFGGNEYPGFGSPPGFLALSNINASDINNLTPITYVQLSGFSLPSGSSTFLTTRIHGIETKDTMIGNDLPGRFGTKHPLIAFCSGNTTGLIMNIVKITGNNLQVIEGQKMTMGLEIEQNGGISGIFDLNISNELTQYKIRSVYTNQPGYTIGEYSGRILCINKGDSESFSPISRWVHLQFGITSSGDNAAIQIKLDDVDLLSIPINPLAMDRDLWSDTINISGFKFDNIRFFNRTYNGSLQFQPNEGGYCNIPYYDYTPSRYYNLGSVTLIDDVILSDDTGSTPTFLGQSAKVIPFSPGIGTNLSTNGEYPDGLLEWSTNASSQRRALKNADGDTGKIYTSQSGAISAVAYNTYRAHGLLLDSVSSLIWGVTQDAIGGIKVYSQAKKEFLDSRYIPVLRTGINDTQFRDKIKTILNSDGDTVIDRTKNTTYKELGQVTSSNSIQLFNQNSIVFNNSYIYSISGSTPLSSGNQNKDIDPDNFFTIESWVYFTGDQPIHLYSTRPPALLDPPIYAARALNFELLCYSGHIEYNYYVDHELAQITRLYFPEPAETGRWYHIAIVRDGTQAVGVTAQGTTYYNIEYPLNVFLNGISGTSYQIITNLNNTASYMSSNYGINAYQYYDKATRYSFAPDFPSYGFNNIDVESDGLSSTISNFSSSYGAISSSGTYSSPATGTLFNIELSSNSNETLFNFTTEYNGNLYYELSTTDFSTNATNNSSMPKLRILKNNIPQVLRVYPYISEGGFTDGAIARDINRNIPESLTAITGTLSVQSGDNIIFKGITDNEITSNFNLHIKNINITDGKTLNSTYYLNNQHYLTVYEQYVGYFATKYPFGALSNFTSVYGPGIFANPDIAKTAFPLFIGGNNLISNYRITQGSISVNDTLRSMYKTNFSIPVSFFPSKYDDYVDIGQIQTLTKTRYIKPYQVYSFNNPITNEPWTTGLIASVSGLILGVKKL